MLIVNVPADELKAAGRISKSVELESILLYSVSLHRIDSEKFYDEKDTTDMELTINSASARKDFIPEKIVSALVKAEATLSKGSAKMHYIVEYLVTYKLPKIPIPANLPESDFDAFARHNSLLNSWPYIRAQINNLSAETGMPILIPLLRIVGKEKAPETKKIEEGTASAPPQPE